MTVFIDGQKSIPETFTEYNAPMKFLECAIYACLLSHLNEKFSVNGEVSVYDMAIRVSGGKVVIVVPKLYAGRIVECCSECFILKNLKLPWSVVMNDGTLEKLVSVVQSHDVVTFDKGDEEVGSSTLKYWWQKDFKEGNGIINFK